MNRRSFICIFMLTTIGCGGPLDEYIKGGGKQGLENRYQQKLRQTEVLEQDLKTAQERKNALDAEHDRLKPLLDKLQKDVRQYRAGTKEKQKEKDRIQKEIDDLKKDRPVSSDTQAIEKKKRKIQQLEKEIRNLLEMGVKK